MKGIIEGIVALAPIIVILCLLNEQYRTTVSHWFKAKPYRLLWFVIAVLGIYSALGLFEEKWSSELFLKLEFYFLVPFIALTLNERNNWFVNCIVVLFLWLPVQFEIFPVHWFKIFGLRYPGTSIVGVLFVLLIIERYVCVELHCGRWLDKDDIKLTCWWVAALLVLVVPTALYIRFLKFGITASVYTDPWHLPVMFIFLFFVVLPEELLFRGYIYGLLIQKMSWKISLIVTALLFGAYHLNKDVGDFKSPNWWYGIFSAIVGVGYGYVYYKRKSLIAAMFLHICVDFIWMVFLRGGKPLF